MIIDRYLMRLVLWPTLAGFALLTLMVSAFNAAALLSDAAYSRIPMNQIFKLIGLRDLITAEVLLPTALYMGVLTTLNQWHRDREAYALYGAGVLPTRAVMPVWLITFVVCLCVAALSLYVRPWAFSETYRLNAAASQLTTRAMQPDHFYNFGTDLVLMAMEIDQDNNEMRDVFVQSQTPANVRVIRAESGRIHGADATGRQRVELQRGISYVVSETTRSDKVSEFETLVYYASAEPTSDIANKRRAAPTRSLLGAENSKERAELQWRFCLPVIAFFMTLIAAEIARTRPNASAYPRLFMGIGVYALIFNLAAVGRTWLENDQVGQFPGMLWVPLVTALLFGLVRQVPSISLRRPG